MAVPPASGVGAGVVGLAGGVPISAALGPSDGIGVFGQGNLGVRGIGAVIGVEGTAAKSTGVLGSTDEGAGVLGFANGASGRGGVFGSKGSAQLQLQLLPHPVDVTKPDFQPSSPTELSGTGIPMALPKRGRGGDVLAIESRTQLAADEPERHTCTLWFCVRSEDQGAGAPAVWSQVLMGAPVLGQT